MRSDSFYGIGFFGPSPRRLGLRGGNASALLASDDARASSGLVSLLLVAVGDAVVVVVVVVVVVLPLLELLVLAMIPRCRSADSTFLIPHQSPLAPLFEASPCRPHNPPKPRATIACLAGTKASLRWPHP